MEELEEMEVGGMMWKIIFEGLDKREEKDFTGCLIGGEMRADRGTEGSCYWALSQHGDIRPGTRVCVREVDVGVHSLLSLTLTSPRSRARTRDLVPVFPGLDHV